MAHDLVGLTLHTDKNITPHGLAALFESVGWGTTADYPQALLTRSLSAYPIVAYCKDARGLTVGYVSAFTDGAFSAFIGELIVRPEYQKRGIGSALLERVVEQCRGVPIYGTPFEDTDAFFLKRGFHNPARAMSVVSMRNAA